MLPYRSLSVAGIFIAVLCGQALADGHNLPSGTLHQIAPPPAGTSFTAVVSANGRLIRGSGATAASQPEGKGTYEVDFGADVTGCAYVATIGEPGSKLVAPAADITVVGRSGIPEGVFVETADNGGLAKNFPFHIDVGC